MQYRFKVGAHSAEVENRGAEVENPGAEVDLDIDHIPTVRAVDTVVPSTYYRFSLSYRIHFRRKRHEVEW